MVDLPRCRTVQIRAAHELRIPYTLLSAYICPNLFVPNSWMDGIADVSSFRWSICVDLDGLYCGDSRLDLEKEKCRTSAITEWLPVARSVRGRYRSLPRIAPRAAIGDRRRSADKI